MKIDVIIPVYKPDEKLGRLLELLSAQTFPVNRIVLMNTGEPTFPEKYLSYHPHTVVNTLEKEAFDHGGTRHAGALSSEADYLLYMTQDAVPEDETLVACLAEAFSDRRVKAAYARQLPEPDCRELERYTRQFNYPETSRVKTREELPELGIKTFFCSNVCAMYERKTYLEQGGFVRRTIFNEDMIYAGGLVKAGFGVAYVAEARVIHSHNYSGIQQFHRNFDLAVSQAEHPEIFEGVRSESEGIRMVLESAKHCVRIGKPWLIVALVYQSGCKFLGYKLGRNYQKLPRRVILWCTMNREYWRKEEKSV